MIIEKSLKDDLKIALDRATGCHIQHTGWTCGTCFYALSPKLTNKHWQVVLAVRGDYDTSELDNLPKNIPATIKKIIKLIS